MTTQTVVLERKDINIHKRLETQNKIPKEYTTFRDALAADLRQVRELQCNTYVPQLYNILRQAGLEPKQARAVVLDDGVNMFGWSAITIDAVIRKLDSGAFDQVKSKAGKASAESKKARKAQLVKTAVDEVAHRGPGRPRLNGQPQLEDTEQIYGIVVDIFKFQQNVAAVAEACKLAGTDKAKIDFSKTGIKNISVYMGNHKVTA